MTTIPETNKINSQFYITLDNCQHLDRTNVVFGKVRKGLNIVQEMVKLERKNDCPIEVGKTNFCLPELESIGFFILFLLIKKQSLNNGFYKISSIKLMTKILTSYAN